ncbi:MAG TPA: hypothetical protein ENI87_05395 [bacterium]|nr:hypothetical protein [bacterium]
MARLAELFGDAVNDELAAGISLTGGLPVLSIRGSKFHVRQGSDEATIMDERGNAASSYPVVIIAASRYVSRVYFEDDYTGDSSAPTCSSLDGKVPEPGVQEPQSDSCTNCPKNAWGSRIGRNGRKAKACQETKRLIVVPAADIACEEFGSPFMLSVPVMSLGDLRRYNQQLTAKKLPYWAVVTELSFDPEADFPKLRFAPIGILDKNGFVDLVRTFVAALPGMEVMLGYRPELPPPLQKLADKLGIETESEPTSALTGGNGAGNANDVDDVDDVDDDADDAIDVAPEPAPKPRSRGRAAKPAVKRAKTVEAEPKVEAAPVAGTPPAGDGPNLDDLFGSD